MTATCLPSHAPDADELTALVGNRMRLANGLCVALKDIGAQHLALMTPDERQLFRRARIAAENTRRHLSTICQQMARDADTD